MVSQDDMDAVARMMLPGNAPRELPMDATSLALGIVAHAILGGWDDARGHHDGVPALARYLMDLHMNCPAFGCVDDCLAAVGQLRCEHAVE